MIVSFILLDCFNLIKTLLVGCEKLILLSLGEKLRFSDSLNDIITIFLVLIWIINRIGLVQQVLILWSGLSRLNAILVCFRHL